MTKALKELKDHPLLYCPTTVIPATLKGLLETEAGTEVLVAFIKKVKEAADLAA